MLTSISKKFASLFLLVPLLSWAGAPVIWNGADAKFLNSGSVKIPGLAGVGCAQFDVNGKFTNTGSACGSGSGSVSSVDMTVPTFLSVSGNPITTSGTLAVTLSGTALPVANGGTGKTSFASTNQVVLGGTTTTGALQQVAAGTTGQFLQSNGAAAPTWITPSYTAPVGLVASGVYSGGTANNPIIFPTVSYDSNSAYSNITGRYTAPVGGTYFVHGLMNTSSTNSTLNIYVNGSVFPASAGAAGFIDTSQEGVFTGSVHVSAGDIIDVRPSTNISGSPGGSTLNIELVPGGGTNLSSSAASGAFHVESAYIVNSGTCTITQQTGTWLASASHTGAGACSLTITTGEFSAQPMCTCSTNNRGGGSVVVRMCGTASASATNVLTETRQGGGTSDDVDFNIICVGPQ